MSQKNICECPNPPGGTVRCEPHQLAICKVENGRAVTNCISPPERSQQVWYRSTGPRDDKIFETLRLLNWAYTAITGIRRGDVLPLEPWILEILKDGKYVNPKTGAITKFSLPLDLRDSLGIRLKVDEGEEFEAGS